MLAADNFSSGKIKRLFKRTYYSKALEIQVEKGCDSIENYSGTRKTLRGVYNADRKCWDSDVKEVTLKTTPQDSGAQVGTYISVSM